MSNQRSVYTLEELCDFTNGFAFNSTDYVPPSDSTIEVFRMGYIERGGGFKEDSTPVFVPKDYRRDLSKFMLEPADITIAMTDMKDRVAILGNTAWIRDANRFVLNQRVGRIRVRRTDVLDTRFLYYYSNSSGHLRDLRSRANSGVQVNLSTAAIKESEIVIPSLETQQAIAHILGTLDDKIELNRRMNETLESMARALFKSWFVDFDPVIDNALAAGNPIPAPLAARAATRRALGPKRKPLPENIQKLFPATFTFDEEIGWIPSSYSVSPVGRYVSIKHGFAFKGEYFVDGLTREVLLTPGNFAVGGGFKDDKLKFYNGPVDDDYVLEPGDLVVTMTDLSKTGDTLGYPAFVPPTLDHRYLHNQRIGRINIEPDSILGKHFIQQTFCSPRYRHHVLATATGSTVRHTSPNRIRDFQTLVAPNAIHCEFERFVTPIAEQMSHKHQMVVTLTKLRDTLLPKLLSGELRIPEAEKLVAGSV